MFSIFEFLSWHMVWPTECNLSHMAEAGRAGNCEASGRLGRLGSGTGGALVPANSMPGPSLQLSLAHGVLQGKVFVSKYKR